MRRLIRLVLCLLPISLLAASCTSLTGYLPAGPTASLVPWQSATVTEPPPTLAPSGTAPIDVGPSATPFKHVVEQGETFLGIAALYGVAEDSLLLANPGIAPNFLSIGQELLIPGPEGTPIGSLIPTSTPIPLALQPPKCYRQASGGVWCLAGIHNPTTQDLENLLLEIRLEDASGSVVRTAQVFPPLNRLPAGETMPVAAAFPEASEGVSASALVLSVITAREIETRYSTPELVKTVDERQEGGLSWRVGGTIALDAGATAANRTLILVTAFDDSEQVVGYAVWEADPPLEPGEMRDFAVRVFSLGPEIARVEMLAESYGITPPEE